MKKTKKINLPETIKGIGLILLFVMAVSLFIFIVMFSIKLATLLATSFVISMGLPLGERI